MRSAHPHRPPRSPPPSAIRNVVVGGRRTSVRLEPLMWDALREIAGARDLTVHDLVTEIDRSRGAPSLTAAIRVYIVDFYRSAADTGREAARAGLRL